VSLTARAQVHQLTEVWPGAGSYVSRHDYHSRVSRAHENSFISPCLTMRKRQDIYCISLRYYLNILTKQFSGVSSEIDGLPHGIMLVMVNRTRNLRQVVPRMNTKQVIRSREILGDAPRTLVK